jgi:exonuclease SbcD
MKIAQFSDLHYCPEYLDEVDRCFSAAVEAAIEEDVEVAVISGDSTDHRVDLHSLSVQKLSERIHTLSNHCPVLMLQGTFSHEPLGTLEVFQYVGGKYPIFVATDIQQVALTEDNAWVSSLSGETPHFVFTEETLPKNTKALFSCLPTVNKAEMVSAIAADDHAALGDVLAELLSAFAPINTVAREKHIPTIGVSHGTVHGCLTEHGVPMIGFDHEFTTGSLFASKVQAYMLGHIHKHQVWENALPQYGTQRIAYPGSIGRLHFGEEGDKGWLFWEIDYRNAACMLMPTPAKQLLHIDFEAAPDVAEIQKVVGENPGAFVRIRYNIPEDQRHTVDRESLQKIVEQAGAKSVKIEGRIIPVVRVRAQGISQSKTLEEKLRKWCENTHCEAAPLVGRLPLLVNDDAETIASDLMHGTPPVPPTSADNGPAVSVTDNPVSVTPDVMPVTPGVTHVTPDVTPDVTPVTPDVMDAVTHPDKPADHPVATRNAKKQTPQQEVDLLDLF